MAINEKILKNDEKAIFELRGLYEAFGYRQYKMSKFEEYDLYMKNKDFLVSDGILTFTDTDGKLMALKPDVTMSIIKNYSKSSGIERIYYNENVYRASHGSGFREILQTGLECIGDITPAAECEVILLAAKSLEKISPDYILEISHMGLVSGLVGELNCDESDKKQLIAHLGEKNPGAIASFCKAHGIGKVMTDRLLTLATAYGTADSVLPRLEKLIVNEKTERAAEELENIFSALSANTDISKIIIDFSVVNDMNYYGGISLRGYIKGIPDGILSGGRYDSLMSKIGKKAGAVGFAVYLDKLERLADESREYDADALLLYDKSDDVRDVLCAQQMLCSEGKTVCALCEMPDGGRFREIYKIICGEAKLQ